MSTHLAQKLTTSKMGSGDLKMYEMHRTHYFCSFTTKNPYTGTKTLGLCVIH